jgi:hypothetical protein
LIGRLREPSGRSASGPWISLGCPAVTGRLARWILFWAGGLWGGSLVMTGLWLALSPPGQWPISAGPVACRVAGVSVMAMGLFVFMCLVADRVFPGMGRRFGWRVEFVMIGIAVVGLPVSIWLLARGEPS